MYGSDHSNLAQVLVDNKDAIQFEQQVLEIDIVMSSLLFMLITYYSVMTNTNECD